MKKVILIITIIIFSSCSKNQEMQVDKNIMRNAANSNQKFAFIRYPNEKEDYYKSINGFGDIYVYNLLDSSIVRYTNDTYYEESLCWSPDGTELLFASSRDVFNPKTDDNSQAFHNLSLFVLRLEDGVIKPLNIHTPALSDVVWLNSGIYFTLFNNKIYKTTVSGGVEVFWEVDEKINIYKLEASQNEDYLAIDFSNSGIGILEIATKTYKEYPVNCELGGWEGNENSFYITIKDSLFLLNISSGNISFLNSVGNNDSLRVLRCFKLNENEIIYSMADNFFSPTYTKSIRDVRFNVATGIENINSKNIWYPIKNDFKWDGITVFEGIPHPKINFNYK